MSESDRSTGSNYSEEVSQRISENELYVIDWAIQAEGCALMYLQTGDTDYELMRVEAEEKAHLQRELFAKLNQLESLI